jgi:formate hydrogenlyase subunit 3/multisubunit Na+/H+ antiporter MnhD subunit
MYVEIEEWLISIPTTALLIMLGNIVLSKAPIVGCILRSLGFLSIALLIKGLDFFSEILLITSSIVGIALAFYTYAYSKARYGGVGLTPLIDIFLFSMVMLFRAKTFIEFIMFWLLIELIALLLIAYDYIAREDVNPLRASIKYLIFSMIPTDLSLFILLAMIGFEEAFVTPITLLKLRIANPTILIIVLLGFFSKAAVIPLHFWLPDAHSVAPSPASALLSGLMVKMGIYGLYLTANQVIDEVLAAITMILLGGLTAVYGAAQASIQQDIKRLLAYSTTSETGILSIALGLYILSKDSIFITASALYSVAHALYKAFMFMDSGYIEVNIHKRNINELGFIHRVSPIQSTSVLMSVTSYLGMPPSIGFLAKLVLFAGISKYLGNSYTYLVALTILILKIAISIIYNAVYLKAHFGKESLTTFPKPILSREDKYFKASCTTMSIYPYIITLPLVMLSIYSGSISIKLKALDILYPLILVSTAISLIALYPLIYAILKYRGS